MGRSKKRRKMSSHQKSGPPLDDLMKHTLFNKTYTYSRCSDSNSGTALNQSLKESLMALKRKLDEKKCLLSGMDIVEWHEHTNSTNPAGQVIWTLRRQIGPELCTQAWCKFHEILCIFGIADKQGTTDSNISQCNSKEACTPSNINQGEGSFRHFKSIHLCEAPGAFITSLNHYLRSHCDNVDWKWIGTTLNPYYEGNPLSTMIQDDRFIRTTLSNWYFGEDDTGDMMRSSNLTGLVTRAEGMGDIHMVTADGSIDCQNNPSEQELVVSRLKQCEVATALNVLSQGGHLVVKMFTMFEQTTVSLMYLFNLAFKEVNVVKPFTSKPGNSEVYVVCVGYLGREFLTQYLIKLETCFDTEISCEAANFVIESIPEAFLQEHCSCCEYFTNLQIQTIETNLAMFQGEHSTEHPDHLHRVRQSCAKEFIDRYNVKKLPKSMWITPGAPSKKTKPFYNHHGTFTDRQKVLQMSRKEQLSKLQPMYVDTMAYHWIIPDQAHCDPSELFCEVIEGKALSRVVSSLYCNQEELSRYNELLNNSSSQLQTPNQQPSKEAYSFLVSKLFEELDLNYTYHFLDVSQDWSSSGQATLSQLQELKCKIDSQEQSQLQCIVCCDVTQHSTDVIQGELQCRTFLLSQVISCLQRLKEHDVIIFKATTSLTRFAAGIWRLLSTLFKKGLYVVHTDTNTVTGFIVWFDMCPIKDTVVEHLKTVQDRVNAVNEMEVLDFTIRVSESFESGITAYNQMLISAEYNALLKKEKDSLEGS